MAAACLLLLPGPAAAEPGIVLSQQGQDGGGTAAFQTEGPWLLDWNAVSTAEGLTIFEMRLVDGDTGTALGDIVERQGGSSGEKLFERPGRYRIVIVGRAVTWRLRVEEISEDRAAELKRAIAGRPSMGDVARQALRVVRDGSFVGWRPESDSILLLFDDSGHAGFRVEMREPCRGLRLATSLSFVSGSGRLDEYDSILLEDGTRCHFERVVATIYE